MTILDDLIDGNCFILAVLLGFLYFILIIPSIKDSLRDWVHDSNRGSVCVVKKDLFTLFLLMVTILLVANLLSILF